MDLHRRALTLRHGIGDHLGVADSLVGIAAALAWWEPVEAARLTRAADAVRARLGTTQTPREAAEAAAALAAIGETAGGRPSADAGDEGGDLDEEAAVARADHAEASGDRPHHPVRAATRSAGSGAR